MLTATKHDQFPSDDRRWDVRETIGLPSTLRGAGHAPADIIVEDLSPSGFLFRSADRFAIDARVQVGLAGSGAADATVVRRDGDLHGCVFARPLSLAQLQAAFSDDVVVQGTFGGQVMPTPQPVVERWPRPVRAAIWLVGGAAPWLLGAVAYFA